MTVRLDITDKGVTINESGRALALTPIAIGTDGSLVPHSGLDLELGTMSFGAGLITLHPTDSITATFNALNVAILAADYQSGSDVDTAIAAALTDYVTSSDLTTTLSSYATTSALTTAINGEVTARNSAITSAINTEVTNRNTAIGVETTRAEGVESTLSGAITGLTTDFGWLHMVGDLHFSPDPGSTYFFDNALVRAYQFNLNGRMLLASDIVDNFAFQSTANGARYADFDVSTARSLVIRNVDGDPTIVRVGTLLADLAVKVGGGQVAISESPAGAMQFTLPDLTTRIPLYASGLHMDANNIWESGSLNCQIMIASLALAFQSPADSFVGFGTNKILNLLSDWSFGWLPTTTGNCTDPSTPSDALLTRAATGAVSVSDRAGNSIGLSAIAPTSSASPGQAGQLAADASFNYRHDGTQWKRAAVTYTTF